MKLIIDLETNEQEYKLKAHFEFNQKNKNEYVGIAYADLLIVGMQRYLGKLYSECPKERQNELEIGTIKGLQELTNNPMWPFDSTHITDI